MREEQVLFLEQEFWKALLHRFRVLVKEFMVRVTTQNDKDGDISGTVISMLLVASGVSSQNSQEEADGVREKLITETVKNEPTNVKVISWQFFITMI